MGANVLIAVIRFYQLTISTDHAPMLRFMGVRGRCKFYPSCSEYTRQAVAARGVRRGLLLGIRRLLKCHPWSAGGVDEAPNSI